jgi:microcystin-dependent protein
MADYSKSTNFTAKDALPTGNSGKIVKGTEIDTEFTAIASAIASKADISSPTFLGTPLAPTAAAGTSSTQIATCAFVLANSVPSGLISMWSGTIATIPSGWYLCDGTNSTPDLRNKFIIGAYADSGGYAKTTITGSSTQTGGTKDAIVVSHTHTATSTVTDPGHSHTISPSYQTSINSGQTGRNDGSQSQLNSSTSSATTGITVATSISTTGSSGTDQNLPPYYALAFIMKS